MDDGKGKMTYTSICCLGVSYVGVPVSTVIAYMCPSVKVAVVDLNPNKITSWNTKQIPSREPGLEELLRKCQNRNLVFTADIEGAIKAADIIFISMVTPVHSDSSGEEKIPNLTDIERAARLIAEISTSSKIIVQKNTVPSGSNQDLKRILDANKHKNVDFQILTMPEFFTTGTAIENLLYPERVLIGSEETPKAKQAVETLIGIYCQWVSRDKIITMSNWSAELAKLSMNAYLGQRLSSLSAMCILCETVGTDVKDITKALGKCSAIGTQYMQPCISFGGNHLTMDLMCLVYMCERLNLPEVAAYWKQVLIMNEYQKKRFKKKIFSAFFHSLANKKIAIWGVAFKRNVEIAKESTAVEICHWLTNEGAKLRVYDPKVEKRQFLDELMALEVQNYEKSLTFCDDPYKAANKAHAIVLLTDWEEFNSVDFSLIYKDMLRPAYIFDARMCLPHDELIKIGFTVRTIGRNFEQMPQEPTTTIDV